MAGSPRNRHAGLSVWQVVWEALLCVSEQMRRTVFALTGIAVGTCAVVATLGMAASANASVLASLDSQAARTITVKSNQQTHFSADDIAEVKMLPGVAFAAGLATSANSTIRTLAPWVDPDGGEPVPIYRASDDLPNACGTTVTSGQWFSSQMAGSGIEPLVLGARAAASLGIDKVAPGRTVFLGDTQYLLVGIVRGSSSCSVGDGVVLPMSKTAPDADTLIVLATPGHGQTVSRALPTMLDPDGSHGITVTVPVDYAAVTARVQGDVNGLYLALGAVSVLVGAIGIANVRLMAVFERAGEIGLRRALGATRRGIVAQFTLESLLLGLVGGVLGASAGLVSVVGVAAVRGWPPVVNPWLPLAGPLAGMAVGVIAGLLPALRAARIEPATALRSAG